MSTHEEMSIHKGLSELKVLNKRIEDLIDCSAFIYDKKHNVEKIKGINVQDMKNLIISNYDKITSLINRRNAIKKAIILSNAKTEVSINGIKYTVAEAIDMKKNGADYLERLVAVMRKQYSTTSHETEIKNADLNMRADNYILGLFGSKDSKVDPDATSNLKEAYIKANTYELIDPINVLEKIDVLNDQLDKFSAEVDSALSESNALTKISIDY